MQLLVLEDPTIGYIYNLIFVVVDRHIKYTKIIPFRYNYSIEKLAHVFKDRIIYCSREGYLMQLFRREREGLLGVSC
jgi:hypothetical protein